MADSESSNPNPWHAIFAFLIPAIGMVVQMHYPDSSPVDKHPANMWMFIGCLFLYCFAFAYYFKCQISTSTDAPYFKLSSKIAVLSGSTATAALTSVLVSNSLLPLIIILYVMFLLIYFAPNCVRQTCKDIGSYVHDMWKRTEGNNAGPTTDIEV